ncbi:hypothetical protein [Thalassospira profundimaris]|uniref:phage major capsid protein n=1 Tax=Thalassospira TaxID=168934 RepID=UPI000DEDFEF0|nr:hypothetical protein [Thalassospira profundimaris]
MTDTLMAMQTPQEDAYKGRFKVRVIRAGLSGNMNFYPDETLKKAVPLFEGVRVFVKSDNEHLKSQGKDVRNLIGRIVDVSFSDGQSPDTGQIEGTLEMIDPTAPESQKLKSAWDRKMTDLMGLSIDAKGKSTVGKIGRQRARIITDFSAVSSVDLIVEPGAGGQVLNLIESNGAQEMDPQYLNDEDVKATVNATRLPLVAKQKLINQNSSPSQVTSDDLREAINTEADYLASVSDSGKVKGLGDDAYHSNSRVQILESRDEKVSKMLDAFFDPSDRSVISIRECYLDITGDRTFSGILRNCDQARLRESLGSQSFGDVLGDSISRRLVAEYNNPSVYDVWQNLVSIVPVNDFRAQERTRFGGYGDLPKVLESNPYTSLSSPTDEKATYSVEKRGGTEDLTLEMITNDDVGAVQRIPTKLVRSAKRTLSKFVLDFLKNNPVVYDGVTLFHATHNNLGTSALDAASVAAGRLAIKSQPEKDSGEKIGIGPRFLWVPDELEEEAVNLFRRNTEQDKTFIQSLSLDVIPVWYWTDVNDWCLSTDTNDVPVIELGFLGGTEEPEIFVQDSPTSGSMFTHDKVTYKIRHIYGGTALDYRGVYKSVVA